MTGINYYGVNADRIIYLDDQQTFKGNLPESGPPKHGAKSSRRQARLWALGFRL